MNTATNTDQRLNAIQNAIETAAHYLQSLNEIIEYRLGSVAGDENALAITEHIFALTVAQSTQIAAIEAQVEEIARIRREISEGGAA